MSSFGHAIPFFSPQRRRGAEICRSELARDRVIRTHTAVQIASKLAPTESRSIGFLCASAPLRFNFLFPICGGL